MKRIAYFPLAVIVLLGAFLALAAAQSDSLADSARAARKDKKETSKKFDNDNLPKTDKLSVVGKPEPPERSEERRVGKECRSQSATNTIKKNEKKAQNKRAA